MISFKDKFERQPQRVATSPMGGRSGKTEKWVGERLEKSQAPQRHLDSNPIIQGHPCWTPLIQEDLNEPSWDELNVSLFKLQTSILGGKSCLPGWAMAQNEATKIKNRTSSTILFHRTVFLFFIFSEKNPDFNHSLILLRLLNLSFSPMSLKILNHSPWPPATLTTFVRVRFSVSSWLVGVFGWKKFWIPYLAIG